MSKIPKIVLKRISRLEELYDIPSTELLKDLEKNYASFKEEYPDKPASSLYIMACRKLVGTLNAELGSVYSRARMHVAFFIGCSSLRDITEAKRRKIMRMDLAERQRYHPDEDTWIDYKTGKPLEGPIYVRTFHGIGNPGKELDPSRVKFLELEAWRDLATQIEVQSNVLYNFRALAKETGRALDYYYVGASRATIFREVSKQLSIDEMEDLIRSCGKTIFTADDLDYLYERNKGTNEISFVEAEVGRIILREGRSAIVELASVDRGPVMVATIPQYLKIDFTQGQQVIFLCRFGDVTLRTGDKRSTAFVEGFLSLPLDRPWE
jgi:hypothetical protein